MPKIISCASTAGMHLDRVYQLHLYCEILVKPSFPAGLGDGELSGEEVSVAAPCLGCSGAVLWYPTSGF